MDLTNIKVKLQISDSSEDTLLATLLSDSIKLIMLHLGVNEFPESLNFIAEEICIKRYRKLGEEGVKISKIDVISVTYESESEYLAPYVSLLDDYKKTIKGTNKLRLL